MRAWDWIKKIPTPEYGNYGGYYNRKEKDDKGEYPKPIDEMDTAYFEHDFHILDNEGLYKRLETIKDNQLKHKIYGPLYRRGAWLVFKIAVAFGVR